MYVINCDIHLSSKILCICDRFFGVAVGIWKIHLFDARAILWKTQNSNWTNVHIKIIVICIPHLSFMKPSFCVLWGEMSWTEEVPFGSVAQSCTSTWNIYTPSVICYDEHKKNLTSIFHEETYVTYESAFPVAVLNTALLCIYKRIFHSQNGTILIKYKY